MGHDRGDDLEPSVAFGCPRSRGEDAPAVVDLHVTLPSAFESTRTGTEILLVSVVSVTAQATGMTLTGANLFSVGLLGCCCLPESGSIPGGGFVVALIIVEAFHMPLELAGIVGGIYRLVDMSNTTVNVMGNMVGSILVAHSERTRIPAQDPA